MFGKQTDSVIKYVCCFYQNEQGKQIVPTSSLTELYKPTSVVPQRSIAPPTYPIEDLWATYGLGFIAGRYRGSLTLYAALIIATLTATAVQIVHDIMEMMGKLLKTSYADFYGELSWTHCINCEEPFNNNDI